MSISKPGVVHSRDQGNSLMLVLVFTAVCLIVVAGVLSWSMANARLTQRHCQYTRAMAAAEAATEKVIASIANDYRNNGQGYVLGNLVNYQAMYPLAAENSAWADFVFMNVAGAPNSTYVEYVPGTSYQVLSSQYHGLKGFPNTFRVISNVSEANSTMNVVGAVQQEIQLSTIPIFQFAIFYNLDLEFNETPVMKVTGLVHANGNIYLSPASPLTLQRCDLGQEYYHRWQTRQLKSQFGRLHHLHGGA